MRNSRGSRGFFILVCALNPHPVLFERFEHQAAEFEGGSEVQDSFRDLSPRVSGA
jgi:hypothetical protein